jgi:hypothetical protein
MPETQRDRLVSAIATWMARLESYPGWKEWKRRHFVRTLHFDETLLSIPDELEAEFKFSDEVEREHAVIIKYLGLHETIRSLKECEFYFRRYPFRGLPVTRHSHITNVCEMYFGRFYEFKERLKSYFDAVSAAVPEHCLDIGEFIRLFERTFDQELRARNYIHHHNRFEDIAIDRILLTDSISMGQDEAGWRQEHLVAYRKFTREWAQRVVRRGEKVDEFLEAIARATLSSCRFLSMDLGKTA